MRRSEYLVDTHEPNLLDFLYIWMGLSLCMLESSGQAASMETHPKSIPTRREGFINSIPGI